MLRGGGFHVQGGGGPRDECYLQHIIQNNTLVSFTHLVQEFGIRSNQFLEYSQLKSSSQATLDIKTTNLNLPPSCSDFFNIQSTKQLLSKIYRIITNSDKTLTIPTIKWETDLSIAPDANFLSANYSCKT